LLLPAALFAGYRLPTFNTQWLVVICAIRCPLCRCPPSFDCRHHINLKYPSLDGAATVDGADHNVVVAAAAAATAA